jgi:GNAT superfamily N-acetyltransferase
VADSVTIHPVSKSTEVEEFIRFPFTLYRDDPHWVPPLLSERRAFLDPKKNPVFEYARIQLFLARRNGKTVGTIAAIRNDRYGEFHPEDRDVGFFGLYEAENDPVVAQALFDTAAKWLRGEGAGRMRGPTNFTTNDVLGVLIEGFDDDPAVLMPYNPPYYATQFEACGFRKEKDLYALEVVSAGSFPALDAAVAKLKERGTCVLRPINLKKWNQELEFVRRCYNESWAKNWGFVPWTDRELAAIAKELKPLVDTRFAYVGEVDGEPVGISIAIPDANEALKLAKGRLFPIGLLRILWKIKVERCNRVRVMALGILPKYRRLGLHALFIHRTIENGRRLGYKGAEVGWILEDNEAMLRALRDVNARRTKVFRVYERGI